MKGLRIGKECISYMLYHLWHGEESAISNGMTVRFYCVHLALLFTLTNSEILLLNQRLLFNPLQSSRVITIFVSAEAFILVLYSLLH